MGKGYFRRFPLYWRWGDNQLLLPFAWDIDGSKAILPVLWGENYFHVVPLYWHWENDHLLFPIGWKIGDD